MNLVRLILLVTLLGACEPVGTKTGQASVSSEEDFIEISFPKGISTDKENVKAIYQVTNNRSTHVCVAIIEERVETLIRVFRSDDRRELSPPSSSQPKPFRTFRKYFKLAPGDHIFDSITFSRYDFPLQFRYTGKISRPVDYRADTFYAEIRIRARTCNKSENSEKIFFGSAASFMSFPAPGLSPDFSFP